MKCKYYEQGDCNFHMAGTEPVDAGIQAIDIAQECRAAVPCFPNNTLIMQSDIDNWII